MVSEDEAWVIRISSKCPYLVGLLSSPSNYYYYHVKFSSKSMFFKFILKNFLSSKKSFRFSNIWLEKIIVYKNN